MLSNLDPDAFGIICRNLIENALRHGTPGAIIELDLTPDGTFRVFNDSDVVAHWTSTSLLEAMNAVDQGRKSADLVLPSSPPWRAGSRRG